MPLAAQAFAYEVDTRDRLARFIVDGHYLTMGPRCREFEVAFARWHQRKHAVLFSSGSCANLALLQALQNLGTLKRGSEVAVSAVTWATNVMPVIQLGMIPAPIDVNPENLETMITGWEGFRFPTQLLGWAHAIDGKWPLIEDNCESLGAKARDLLSGNFGLASTASFFVGHQMSTIEGGMVVTDDDALRDELVMVRSNGWRRDVAGDLGAFDGRYTFGSLAFNFRPTEITGVLGLIQLPSLDARLQRRRDILAEIRARNLSETLYIPGGEATPMALPFICDPGTRPGHLHEFESRGIECRPVVAGDITQQPFWHEHVHTLEWYLPGARRINDDGFYCALHPDMSQADVDLVVEAINAG